MTEEEALREIAQLEDLVAALQAAIDALTAERDLLKVQISTPIVDMAYVNNLRAAYTKKCLENVQSLNTLTDLRQTLTKAKSDVIKAEVTDG